MIKVLIYYDKAKLAPIGGPAGYLYSLNKGLKETDQNNIEIDFLESSYENNRKTIKRFFENIKFPFKNFFLDKYRNYKFIKWLNDLLSQEGHLDLDLSQYDIIHFHTTHSLYKIRSQLKNFNGLILLTSHSPEPLTNELISNLNCKDEEERIAWYNKLIKVDRYAFMNTDYIVLPCEYADEPYIHKWDDYAKITEGKKYKYVPTGTNICTVPESKTELRKRFGIPEDSFVLCYVGRHNEIKGYDRFKEIASKFLSEHENAFVIVAGTQGPIYGLNHARWKEIGWTKTPYSVISCSDVFILSNRETFFDLILLETLSIGRIALISDTGGNKYFQKFEKKGIFTFTDNDDANKKLEYIFQLSKNQKAQLEQFNRELFIKNFSLSEFAKKYIEMYKEIYNENL